jgi:hypothetical protein
MSLDRDSSDTFIKISDNQSEPKIIITGPYPSPNEAEDKYYSVDTREGVSKYVISIIEGTISKCTCASYRYSPNKPCICKHMEFLSEEESIPIRKGLQKCRVGKRE